MLQFQLDLGCEACYNPEVDKHPTHLVEVNGDHVDEWAMFSCPRCSQTRVTVYWDVRLEEKEVVSEP